MGIIQEFKEFAMRGSVVDLAVGVVIGGAFGKIVSSFVENIVMPPLNLLTAKYGVNFNQLAWEITTESPTIGADGKPVLGPDGAVQLSMQPYPILKFGPFIQTVVDFLLIALAIFVAVKIINMARARFEQKKEEGTVPPPEDIQLLREIRDALKDNK